MSIVKAQKIQKSYGHLTVLSDISFSLERGQKVALVGYNGIGKTTLIKIIAGVEDQDAGKIDIDKNACIGYLPQDTSISGDMSIGDYLRQTSGIDALEKEIENLPTDLGDIKKINFCNEARSKYEHLNGYSFDHRAKIMLSGFGFENIGLDNLLANLSSGQKSKVALAGILLKGVDLLLLDEPTNNLDISTIIWLEDFLQKSKASCIIVSHDRRFLDKVANKIFELNWHTHTLAIVKGIYSDYLEMVARRIEGQKEKYQFQQKEIKRLAEQASKKKADAAQGSHWHGSDNDKSLRGFKRDRAAKSSKTAKAIEKRIDQMDKIEKPAEMKPFEILLDANTDSGVLDICLSNVVAGYSGIFCIGPISLEIRYGDRIGILGLNGTGKSTLLKTITNQIAILSGEINIGSGVRIGNMTQEHETLPRERTLLEFIEEQAHFSQQDSYIKLSKFGFNEKQMKLPIGILSPGGRARFLLALFSAQSVNTLVLDEPTNHLDIEALDALEKTLKTYRGTVLLVSHDRYFLEKTLLDTTYVLSGGILIKIPDYRTYVKLAEEKARKLLKLL